MIKKIYHSARRRFVSLKLKYGLYRHEIVEDRANWDYLESKYPYENPVCVSDDFVYVEPNKSDIALSVIVPLYNSERYVPQLIEMLSNQDTKYSYEVIFVDDGSKDNTRSVIDEAIVPYRHMRIVSQENMGIAGARNTGIDSARGDFLAFIDHDDEITNSFVERLMKKTNESDADIVKCYYGQKVNGKLASIQSASGFVWGGVYARKLFQRVRFPKGYWYEDMINPFLLKPQAHSIVCISDVLYYSNYNGTNASKKMWRNDDYRSLQQIYLCRALVDDYRKLGMSDKEYLMRRVLKECGKLGSSRMKKLDVETRKSAFSGCCEIFDCVKYIGSDEDFGNEVEYRVLNERNFIGWCFLSELA